MRIALSHFPFSRIGKTYNTTIAEAGKTTRVFYLEIPENCVGFLYYAGINTDLPYALIIDDEEVNEIIGTVNNPSIFNPPFLIQKYIAFDVKNNTEIDKIVEVYADGECYEELTLMPIVEKQQKEIEEKQEIKENIVEIKEMKKSEEAKGIVFDKKITVTDKIKMLDKKGGLNWTAVDITNAGPNPVYFSVNEWRQPEAPLDVNLTANVDLGKKNGIKKMFFVCDKGKSTTVYLRILK